MEPDLVYVNKHIEAYELFKMTAQEKQQLAVAVTTQVPRLTRAMIYDIQTTAKYKSKKAFLETTHGSGEST